jgi:hypothetical protein
MHVMYSYNAGYQMKYHMYTLEPTLHTISEKIVTYGCEDYDACMYGAIGRDEEG